MRFCTGCHRITAGHPLFCNICGQSYNIRFCPRLHPNPRAAQVCSQCGSRDLSNPQPKLGFGTFPFVLLARVLPGVPLLLATGVFVAALIYAFLQAHDLILPLVTQAGFLLAVTWLLYLLLPRFLQSVIKGIWHALMRLLKMIFGSKGKDSGGHR